ncbi:MAG: cupin domain-containing protein, partial [bacterium]|nr:cupin domain-containing protein [bacterium]
AYTTLNLLNPLLLHSEFHPFVIVCERSSFTPQEVSIVGEQFVFMLSGSLDYFYDDVLYTLRPGDALYFNALVPHGPRTLHTGHAEYLTCFVTEAYAWFDMRLHFRGGSPLPPHLPSSRPLPQRLARKLRLVRLNRFELLETVSARAGLKVSTLAALEQGQVNPSAATLLRLAHAFNLPLQYFLDPTDYPHQACFTPVEARARAAVTSTQGNYRYALAQPLGAPLFFMPELHIYHRRAHLPPLATSPGQFFVFIIDGTCEFRCGDALFTLQPGDALTGYSRDPHGLTRLLTSHVSLLHITSDLAGMLATALEHMR